MSYQESQDRIFEAETALRAGDANRAHVLFREAARLQQAFVALLPPERVRTKSVYGLSVASLLYKAGDLDEAERLAGRLLGEDWLEPYSADGLRALLAQIWLDRGEPGRPDAGAEASRSRAPSRPPTPLKRRTLRRLVLLGPGRRLAPHVGAHP